MLRGDVQAGSGAADFAPIEEDCAGRAGDCSIEIGVREDDTAICSPTPPSPFYVPAAAATISRPTSVEPVNVTLSTSGWALQRSTRRGAHAGDDIQHALRESRLEGEFP